MGELIKFDDEKFKILYKLPAESPEGNKKARLIYKACEIYHRVKEKQEEKCENKKSKL